jgi:hypothetical protein
MSKRTSYGKIYRPDVPSRPRLSRERDFPRGRILSSTAVKIRPRRCTQASVRMQVASARIHSPLPSLPSPPSCPVRTQTVVRADGLRPRPPGHSKKNIKFSFYYFILVVVAGWKREKKISVFGFQSPRSPGFAGEVTRRRRFFRPSSPSHPSKLYSSLGWLNSKGPKPFSPFTLRLIDVDGF